MKDATPTPHVAILATPGMGHLIPMVELAKRLAARHGATATLFTFASTASSAAQRSVLASLPPSVSSYPLPPVDLSDLPRDAVIETLMSAECERSVAALAAILTELNKNKKKATRLVAFVTDFFGADAFDAARDAGVERRCLFISGNLHDLTLALHLPEFRDLADPVRLPGCVPIPVSDIVPPLLDRSSHAYVSMVHLAERCRREADAFLVNSFDAIEPEVAMVLRRLEPGRPPVYPIGPLIRTPDNCTTSATAANDRMMSQSPRAACLEWLDQKPAGSVIYVSFGSGGVLPVEEMCELALGLELSGQRFLWVVRSPSDNGSLSDNYYDAESKKDPYTYLPEGFIERTNNIGLVVSSWAPQIEVLAHKATRGFLSHCGWNSSLESLVHGVPMVAWPLFAEQRMNAVVLAEGIGAAIRLPETKDKESIAAVVRELMVGERKGALVRAKVAEVQKAAAESLREGGASTTALDEVVNSWVRGKE